MEYQVEARVRTEFMEPADGMVYPRVELCRATVQAADATEAERIIRAAIGQHYPYCWSQEVETMDVQQVGTAP